jgi:hypothetical protein
MNAHCIFQLIPFNSWPSDIMNFHFFNFLVGAVLALLVHADTTPGIRAEDDERSNALFGILDNSVSFSAIVEAVMPRIKEWLVHPFDKTFSSVTNSSSVFTKLAEYVVESKKGYHPYARSVYSSNENETAVQFEPRLRYRGIKVKRYLGIEVKLKLIFRASEHGFRASEFHRICDGKEPTITLVKAENGRMEAAYSDSSWEYNEFEWVMNPRGFVASIAENPAALLGYSLQKYALNRGAHVVNSFLNWGPYFGYDFYISNRCHENEYSFSILGYGYGQERVDLLVCEGNFRVLEYEVFQVEMQDIVLFK